MLSARKRLASLAPRQTPVEPAIGDDARAHDLATVAPAGATRHAECEGRAFKPRGQRLRGRRKLAGSVIWDAGRL
eukprot:2745807-Pyramimonas_sp.AAC.1